MENPFQICVFSASPFEGYQVTVDLRTFNSPETIIEEAVRNLCADLRKKGLGVLLPTALNTKFYIKDGPGVLFICA